MKHTPDTALDALFAELAARKIRRAIIGYHATEGERHIERLEFVGPGLDDDELAIDLDELCYQILDSHCPAWNNTTGSHGNLTLFLPEGYMIIDHAQHLSEVTRYHVHVHK